MERFEGSFDDWIRDFVGIPTYKSMTLEQKRSCYHDYSDASSEKDDEED